MPTSRGGGAAGLTERFERSDILMSKCYEINYYNFDEDGYNEIYYFLYPGEHDVKDVLAEIRKELDRIFLSKELAISEMRRMAEVLKGLLEERQNLGESCYRIKELTEECYVCSLYENCFIDTFCVIVDRVYCDYDVDDEYTCNGVRLSLVERDLVE